MIFTQDKNGNPGHPTRKLDMAGRLIRRKRARMVGGGVSGKPPVLIFLDREFDQTKQIDRKFYISLDPGYVHTGFCMGFSSDDTFYPLLMGKLLGRTCEIRKFSDERRMHRRRRRSLQRRRNKRILGYAKFKAPRWKNRRKTNSKSLNHLVQTQKNLVSRVQKLAPVPNDQVRVSFEYAVFDVRRLTWGPANGVEYQDSPRGKKTKTKKFVLDRDGGCVVCGQKEDLHRHHLKPRKRQGTDRAELLVCLCLNCHDGAHKGIITLPIADAKGEEAEWRAMSMVNQTMGILRKTSGWTPVPVSGVVETRQKLCLEKTHALDAVCVGIATAGTNAVCFDECRELELKQFKRHNRARTKSVRERNYKLNGKIVAQNRKKRMDQKRDSLEEFRTKHPGEVGRLMVYPGKRLAMPRRQKAPTLPGEIWSLNGKCFFAEGVHAKKYIFSKELLQINGKKYVLPEKCTKIRERAGMMVAKETEKNCLYLPH